MFMILVILNYYHSPLGMVLLESLPYWFLEMLPVFRAKEDI